MKEDKVFTDYIVEAFEEEAYDIEFSQENINRVLGRTSRSRREKLRRFLDYEISLPLIPASIAVAALLFFSLIPLDLFKDDYKLRVIDIEGSQILIREGREVAKNEI